MNDKKKGKLQIVGIVLIISLFVVAFVTFFLGHYMAGSVLFVIFMILLNAISGWTRIKNKSTFILRSTNTMRSGN